VSIENKQWGNRQVVDLQCLVGNAQQRSTQRNDMKKTILAGLFLGLGGTALAGEPDQQASSAPTEPAAFQKKTTFFGPLRFNTTWAETGVAATGIASSDFLHNNINKPATSGAYNHAPTPAVAPQGTDAPVASAGPPPMTEESSAPASAPSSSAASEPKPTARKRSSSSSGSKPQGSSTSRPSRSTYSSSGKGVVTSSGKDIMVTDLVADPPPPLFEVSIDGGYQSRYYHLGSNRVLAGGFVVDPLFASLFEGRLTKPEDTSVYYGGVSAHWNGFGLGVKYVRGVDAVETRFSTGDNLVRTEYEELVADLNYTFAVLPGGWLTVTGGYRAMFFDEDTFYNTDRFDDFYVTIGNSVIPYLRPSVTYHYLDQADALGANENTIMPGSKIHTGDLLIAQVDGQIGLPKKTGLPFDVVYYVQVGFDNKFNVETNNWDQNWTQVGVTLPIFVGPLTVSPNWNYNENAENLIEGRKEHFWGVNVRFDF